MAAAAAKSLQSCPTLSDPIDGSPPGSSVHGIFQARVLEWGATAFSTKGDLLSLMFENTIFCFLNFKIPFIYNYISTFILVILKVKLHIVYKKKDVLENKTIKSKHISN